MGWEQESASRGNFSIKKTLVFMIGIVFFLFFAKQVYSYVSVPDISEVYFNEAPEIIDVFDSLTLMRVNGGPGGFTFVSNFDVIEKIKEARSAEVSATREFVSSKGYIDNNGIQGCVLAHSDAVLSYLDMAKLLVESVTFEVGDLERYKEMAVAVVGYKNKCMTKIINQQL